MAIMLPPGMGGIPGWKHSRRPVLVDTNGEMVRFGRNRSNEKAGPVGQVVGSYIAHAEINALATLPPGDYGDYTLYTSLEPCFLCTAALRHSHVGVVRFAAPDPMWRGHRAFAAPQRSAGSAVEGVS